MAAPFQRRCAKCDGVFERAPGPWRGRSAHARYCSLSCRVAAEREAQGLLAARCVHCGEALPMVPTRIRAIRQPVPCAHCEVVLFTKSPVARRRRADSLYCSGRCRVAAHRARLLVAA